MHRFRILGLAFAAVLAAGLLSAGGASAAKQVLVLREGGEHLYGGLDPVLPVGAEVEFSLEVALGGCAMTPIVVTAGNSAKKDPVALDERLKEEDRKLPLGGTCLGEYEGKKDSIEAYPKGELALSTNGAAKIRLVVVGVDTQNSFGECSYGFDLKKATFPIGGGAGETVIKGTAKGKGGKGNVKTCPKKVETAFTMTLADNGGFPLEATLGEG
jgi:hypothetical protein